MHSPGGAVAIVKVEQGQLSRGRSHGVETRPIGNKQRRARVGELVGDLRLGEPQVQGLQHPTRP